MSADSGTGLESVELVLDTVESVRDMVDSPQDTVEGLERAMDTRLEPRKEVSERTLPDSIKAAVRAAVSV